MTELLTLALLVGVAISVWRLLRRDRGPAELAYLTSPESDAAHVVMNLAMVAMLLPGYDADRRAALFVVLGALLVVLLVLVGVHIALPGRFSTGSLVYHVLASAAMIYAVAVMPAMSMGAMGSMHHVPSAGVTLAAVVLAALFAVDAVLTAGIVVFAPRAALAVAGGTVDGGAAATLRVASVPHLVMDVAMVIMLAAV